MTIKCYTVSIWIDKYCIVLKNRTNLFGDSITYYSEICRFLYHTTKEFSDSHIKVDRYSEKFKQGNSINLYKIRTRTTISNRSKRSKQDFVASTFQFRSTLEGPFYRLCKIETTKVKTRTKQMVSRLSKRERERERTQEKKPRKNRVKESTIVVRGEEAQFSNRICNVDRHFSPSRRRRSVAGALTNSPRENR